MPRRFLIKTFTPFGMTFLQSILIVMALSIVVTQGSAQPLFEVQRESFCKEVQSREPISPVLTVAEIKKGETIFLWIELNAGERALTMLEAKQRMPIYHAWASDAGVTDIIDVGITKERWEEQSDAIRREFKRRGFFTWRTQSLKRNLKKGRWYVSILDANKRPVRKVGLGVEAFRPEILIRFIP